MASIPPGFSRRELDGAVAVLRDDAAASLVAAGIAVPESLRRRADAAYEGRGAPFGVGVPGAGRVFVRQYLHGGALRKVTRDLYRGDGRFLAELTALTGAAKAGVPVPEALGFVSQSAGLGLRRGWLLTREVPGAVDVLRFLRDAPSPARRRTVLAAAGRAIRALHDAAFEHPDLHLKNLLLAPTGEVLVLDLDRAERVAEMTRERRLAAIFRFDRFAAKQAASGMPVSRTDRLRVLRSYAGPDWPEGTEVREIGRRLARHIARHRSRRAARAGAALR